MYKDKQVIVVMPAYNAARTISKTYDEVMAQEIVDLVIVVDDDIDVEDPRQVMWAIATRVDFERDTELLSGLPGPGFDVSTGGRRRVSKLILDATKKLEEEGYPGKFPEAGWPAQDVMESVRENWGKYGLD